MKQVLGGDQPVITIDDGIGVGVVFCLILKMMKFLKNF